MEHEKLLSMVQLAGEMSKIFDQTVHPDRIKRRLKMGIPYRLDRTTGFRKFLLSEVLEWWIKFPTRKAS